MSIMASTTTTTLRRMTRSASHVPARSLASIPTTEAPWLDDDTKLYQNFIENTFVSSRAKKTIPVHNPANQELLGRVPENTGVY